MKIEYLEILSRWSAALLEFFGIAVIMLVAIYATSKALIELLKGETLAQVFRFCRLRISRAILMGLEFLVAADIIYILAVDWTFTNLGILGFMIVIRAFLIVTLEMEITGRWPWQRKDELPP